MVSDERYNKILEKCEEKGYELITPQNEINNNQSYITYICPKHGEYTTRVTSIIQGKSCYKCSREIAGKKKWKHGEKERIKERYKKLIDVCSSVGYTPLFNIDSDLRYHSYIEYECPIHGKNSTTVGNFLSGRKCPKCNIDRAKEEYKLSVDEVKERVSMMGTTILNADEYINQDVKNLKIICPQCGKIFITCLKHFQQHGGQSCDNCCKKESVGERKIRQYLEQNAIKYEQEKMFPDCRDDNMLRFDFYLKDYNMVIEFDGEQHYKKKHFFIYDHEKNLLHDEIKNEYCNKNNIEILRIPYWEINNIESILDEQFNQTHDDIV